MGFSMGAAVALQAAADDPRIDAVVAVSPFSDLRTIVHERAPFFATRRDIARAFELAEQAGQLPRRRGQPAGRGRPHQGARADHPRRARHQDAARALAADLRRPPGAEGAHPGPEPRSQASPDRRRVARDRRLDRRGPGTSGGAVDCPARHQGVSPTHGISRTGPTMISRRRTAALAVAGVLLAIGAAAYVAPSFGANAILYPKRRPMTRQPHQPFEAVDFEGAGVKLKGWWFHAPGKARDRRLSSRRRGQPRVGRRDRGSFRAARVRGHRLRQPRARRVGGGCLHVRVLREAGSPARPRSGDGEPDRGHGRLHGRRGGVAGGGGGSADRGRGRGLVILRSAHRRRRARPVLRDHGKPSPGRSSSPGKSASSAWTTSARWPRPPTSRRRR